MDKPRIGTGMATMGLVGAIGFGAAALLLAFAPVPPARSVGVPLGPQTGPAPAPNMPGWRDGFGDEQAGATIVGGRTGYNDRQLVLQVDARGAGNREQDGPDTGCGVEVRGEVEDDGPDSVTLLVRVFDVPPARSFGGADIGCTTAYGSAFVVVLLPTPLAGRRVVDGMGAPGVGEGVVPIRDGSSIALPMWTPDRYALTREDPNAGTFTFAEPRPDDWPERRSWAGGHRSFTVSNTERSPAIPSLDGTQGDAEIESALDRILESGREVTVHGRRAALVRDVPFLPVLVTWREDDRWWTVSTPRRDTAVDDGIGTPLTDDELLRIAESMRMLR